MKTAETKYNVIKEGRGGCLDVFVTLFTAGNFGLMTQIVSKSKYADVLAPTKTRRVIVRTPKVKIPIVDE